MQSNLRKLPAAWPLVIFLLFPALTRGETAVQAWVQRYNGPGNGSDCAYAVAVDGSNNVLVTGTSWDSGYVSDSTTIKYSSGGVPLWTNRYNGPQNASDGSLAITLDASGNAYVAGYSTGSGGYVDYLTIKYSSAGVPLWTNRYNGPGNRDDWVRGIAVDTNGNVYVTGYSYGGSSGDDYATIAYSSAGEPLWTNRYNGPGNGDDPAYAVAVDSNGNVYVTGGSAGSGGHSDYLTIKYSSAGVPLWTNRYDGPGNSGDAASAIAVDGSNNVIVTGYSGTYFSSDYLTIKYSGDGVPLWTNQYDGPSNGDDRAQAVAVDTNDNVYVTGYSQGSSTYPWNEDYFTIKYSSAGVPLWTNRYNGPSNLDDEAQAIAVDRSGKVYVTGYSTGSGGGRDYATIAYSSAGVPLWTDRYTGPGNFDDTATAVAVDRSGNVIVTGFSPGSGGDTDFATIKYICVPSPVMTGPQWSNGTFHIRVEDVMQPGTLVIEAGTNLAGWGPVFTNTTPTNVLFYTDPKASNYLRRFYRAFQFP
jgi:uncharacterized delta-60 repeat protein